MSAYNGSDLEAIYGITLRSTVDHVTLMLKTGKSLQFMPKVFGADPASGYFAFVVKRSEADDLLAYDMNGRIIASGRDKIRTATDSDAPAALSTH
jgi:hypothetical protein